MSQGEVIEGLAVFIGKKFREARQLTGRSQASLSEAAGVARISTLSLELGREKNPKIQTIFALARELGADLGEIVKEYEASV